MDAMEYEFLLRSVYKCGRDYEKGADADIYRDMERAYTFMENKTLHTTRDDPEYEYRVAFAKVRGNVENAITEGIAKVRYTATTEDMQALEQMKSLLTYQMYDKQMLDKVIDDSGIIFHRYGLQS